MTSNKSIIAILLAGLFARLFFAFSWHGLLWDSGVYLGMGKYLFSLGTAGLWEHIRPPLVPLILGLLWKLSLDPLLFGRLTSIAFMIGAAYLTYRLGEHWFSQRAGLIAAILVGFSPIFFYLSFHQYTEIPSMFFALLALFLFTQHKHFWSGIAIGLAFLAKFPAGIFLAAVGLALLYSKNWRGLLLTGAGFALSTAPYFLFNTLFFGTPWGPLLAAQDTISRALGCNVLRYQPWWKYGNWLILSENILYLFALPGLAFKKWNRSHVLFWVSLLLPILYLLQLHCRDYRYLTLFLPFVAMLAGQGIIWLYDSLRAPKKHFWLVLITVFLASLTMCLIFLDNKNQEPHPITQEYHTWLSGKEFDGEIWISNPLVAAHTDARLHKIYYPIYDEDVSRDFFDYFSEHNSTISVVMLDNCGGGIICAPDDDF